MKTIRTLARAHTRQEVILLGKPAGRVSLPSWRIPSISNLHLYRLFQPEQLKDIPIAAIKRPSPVALTRRFYKSSRAFGAVETDSRRRKGEPERGIQQTRTSKSNRDHVNNNNSKPSSLQRPLCEREQQCR